MSVPTQKVAIFLSAVFILLHLASACGPGEEPVPYLETTVVTSEEDAGDGTLRQALSWVRPGGSITFADNVRVITLSAPLEVRRDITILNENDHQVRLMAQAPHILSIEDNVRRVHVEGLSFENSTLTAIVGTGELTVVESTFRNNGGLATNSPSVIDIDGGLVVRSSRFDANYNTNVRITGDERFILEDVVFENPPENTGHFFRLFVAVEGPVSKEARVVNSSFDGARHNIGGVLFQGGTDFTVENSTFRRLRLAAGSRGGALVIHAKDGESVLVKDTIFEGNGDIVRDGPNGALTVELDNGASLHVEDSEFNDNRARGRGPGIHIVGSSGGDRIRISNTHFQDNEAGGSLGLGGGAIYVTTGDGARMVVEDSTFLGNNSTDAAAAIQVTTVGNNQTRADVVIRDCAFKSNSVESRTGTVRASFNDLSTMKIERSLFAGNFSADEGSAVAVSGGHRLTITNSTFTNNRSFDAGTIYSTASATRLAFLTLVGNRNSTGGAILYPRATGGNNPPILRLRGSLLANNEPVDIANPFGGHPAQTRVEFSALTSFADDVTNIADGQDANLVADNIASGIGTLRYNGGDSETLALNASHPAIGAVPEADCVDTEGAPVVDDQRQHPRPVSGTCTIGAWERD